MLLATAIFAVFLHIVVGEKNSFSKVHEYPETQIYMDYRQIDGIPFVYARCNSSQPKLGRQCIVTMQFDAFEKTAGETKECQVNLKPKFTNGVINDRYYDYAFGRDKVLLVWTETQSASDSEDKIERSILKATVVHMFDNCRTFEANVREDLYHPLNDFDESYINVITFNNTFEMRLAKLKEDCKSKSSCPADQYHLHKFDEQARRIGEAEHWPMPPFKGRDQYSIMEAMKFDQPEKGYFVVNDNWSEVIVELVTKTSAGYNQLKVWQNSSKPKFGFTLSNEAIGFCSYYANANFDCWQSDHKGHILTQTHFTLDIPKKTYLKAIYNLGKGGLLLAVPTCSKTDCHKADLSKYFENFYLMEIDGKSNVKSVEVHFENKCDGQDNTVFTRLFENKQGQYCIARLCQSLKSSKLAQSRSESSVHCYSTDEFSKCTNCL